MIMNLIDRDKLLEWVDKAQLTPDGGVDINDLKTALEAAPVLMEGNEYALAKDMLTRLARKLEEAILNGMPK